MLSAINHSIAGTSRAYVPLAHRFFPETYQGDVEFRGLPECSLFLLDLYLIVHSSGLAYGPAIRFNGDTANNYVVTKGNLTNIPVFSQTAAQSYIEVGSLMGNAEAAFMRVIVPGTANSVLGRQLVQTFSYTNGSGAGDTHIHAGQWNNGDRINRISIVPGLGINGQIGVGTYMTLYGMK